MRCVGGVGALRFMVELIRWNLFLFIFITFRYTMIFYFLFKLIS